jgi:Protein of unknown function (DUF3160).
MNKKKKICIAAAVVAVAAIATVAVLYIKPKIGGDAKSGAASYEEALKAATSINWPNTGDYKNVESYLKAIDSARRISLDRQKIFFDSLKNVFSQKTDFEQDLNKLPMNELLYLRSSIYATHGLYFYEENLNSYFLNKENPRVPWYRDYMCFLLEYAHEKKGKGFIEAEKDVSLSDTEKRFVEKIDGRIAELRKNDMYVNKNSYTVGNAAHIINMHKFKNFGQAYMDKIALNNFVIEEANHEQLFHLYEQNDYARMPSFVTTDLFLQSFHMYLSYILKKLEHEKFIPAMKDLSIGLYNASMELAKSEDAELAQIAEYNATFYAIPYTLLTGERLKVPAKYQNDYDGEINYATEAKTDGVENSFLARLAPKNEPMLMHYSLFKPRGHYTRNPEMERYFRAMMWLQKAFSCRDREAHLKQNIFTAILLNTAKTAKNKVLMEVYSSVFEPTALLIGESNNLSVMDIALFLKNEKIENMSQAFSAESVGKVDKMLKSIAGRIIIKPKILMTCPDKINFMPQRYLIDNEVLQDLVDIRVNAERAFPKGLDVFHAFGSETAGDVLNNFYKEKEKWAKYPDSMAKLQKKFKNFDGWNKSTYNKWIESLVALQKKDKSYPVFMNTSAWDYKNLNTSLASWAELKHDFILYADQPMAAEMGGGCEDTPFYLPEPKTEVGYVEPNILFWNKLNELITLTYNVLAKHNLLDNELKGKTKTLQEEVSFLIEVSKKELAKTPLSSQEYQRIKKIGGEVENFTLTVLDPEESFGEWQRVTGPDRSIAVTADIYTRNVMLPSECPKNGVLHVATGNANTIYVVVEIEGYLYLTRGATFSYYEFVMPPSTRLTDEEWQVMEADKSKRPAIPEWMQDIVVDKEPYTEIREDVHPIACFFRGCEDEAFYQ